MLLVALRGLQRRARRTFLGVLSIALIVAMFIVIQSVSDSFVESFFSHVYNTDADVWVSPAASFSGMGGSYMDESVLGRIAEVPGVKRAEPTVTASSRAIFKGVKTEVTVVGYEDAGAYSDVELSSGRMPQGADEAVIDESVFARLRGLALGDTLRINGRDFEVVGMTRNRKMVASAVVLLPIDEARQLLEVEGGLSSFALVTAAPGATAEQVQDALSKELGDEYRAVTKAENIAEWSRQMSYIQLVLSGVSALAFIIGALVMTIIVYISVVERTREIGILKALGATDGSVRALVVLEAISIAVPGLALGAAIATVLAGIMPRFIPIQPELPLALFGAAAAITIVVALVGSIVGMRRAVKVDPVVALRTV